MNQKGFSGGTVLITISLFLALILLGFYLSKKDNTTINRFTSYEPAKTPISEAKENVFATFTVRLPEKWKPINYGKLTGVVEIKEFQTEDKNFTLLFQVSDDPYPLNELSEFPNYNNITLDGQPAVKFTIIGGQAANIYTPTVQSNYAGKRYLIHVATEVDENNQDEKSKIADEELEQILTSFKFAK